jgi:F-box-like
VVLRTKLRVRLRGGEHKQSIVMGRLLAMPHELLHSIFVEADPEDLAALSGTCKAFNKFIWKNCQLFKQMYLKKFVRNVQPGFE